MRQPVSPPGPFVHSAFEARCREQPGHTAVVAGERRVGYCELASQARGISEALQDAGIGPGERVVLLLDSGIDYVAALHAVWRLGAVVVPLGPQTKAPKLAHVLADTGARALLTQAMLSPVWTAALGQLGDSRIAVWALGAAPPPAQAWPRPATSATPLTGPGSPNDLATLLYTSGTTGVPKGVMLSHANMLAAWRSVQAYLHWRPDDVIGLALPPTFSYGLYHVVMGLGLGATLVLENSAAFPVRLLQRLAAERITVFPGVPTLWASLLALDLSAHDLSALRLITNAAAALPAAHVAQLRQRLPRARLLLMYGLTECMRASYLPHEEIDARPDSVGRGLPFQEHWLEDEAGQRLPHGSTGELVVRGAHVSAGYWNAPSGQPSRLTPGPRAGENTLRTGDVFRSDADGWLTCVGRTDDMFKSRGEKVYPLEVEHAICELPGVREAAVAGTPDDRMGHAVKAFVRLRDGAVLSEREVIRHCLARLDSWMAPKTVAFVDELPLTESGKLRRRDLA
ncbi:class I adenylate-forming enzyme family protein [Hydrogenophaga sp. 2FB]|uniref:class I adenylate-forming enzyme family protein n=1 Tax=Hydrogenophaga sp. 2FB TaxID=2502187 RepID=UPI00148574B6|nr:class I adenylate-forming enzyme family protein [Hydrogenophaga sp. 2FB]